MIRSSAVGGTRRQWAAPGGDEAPGVGPRVNREEAGAAVVHVGIMKLLLMATALVGSVLCLTGVIPMGLGSSNASDDLQTLWYPSGQVKSRAETQDGVREGAAGEWYANGQERCSGQYVDGLREGPWVFFDENGAIDSLRTGVYAAGARLEG